MAARGGGAHRVWDVSYPATLVNWELPLNHLHQSRGLTTLGCPTNANGTPGVDNASRANANSLIILSKPMVFVVRAAGGTHLAMVPVRAGGKLAGSSTITGTL